MAELPRCETLRDIQTLSGRQVLLVGLYQQVDMRMRPKPPPVYRGHVRENHEGRRVEVTGIIHEESPAPPEMAAYTTGPVLSPVERIQPAQ
ncbi:hypothetical protein [Archangium lansingense]|uniref:Lipoprotein n=1 Tax=Archangium lansingense TaxID=2995310 RepID=A0ABT3ZWL8_9BACT|nr:hypothetical protein [Archangium lansinium]MCY1073798.1 hypothetical protein [Archangium lansinium]